MWANVPYFGEKWRTFGHILGRMKIMVLHTPMGVIYAPLYIHSFQLVRPHTLVEAEKFNIQYTDPSQIHNTPDKLRWYRYSQGLRQKDVAEYAGIDRTTYSNYTEKHDAKRVRKIPWRPLWNLAAVGTGSESNIQKHLEKSKWI